MFHIAAAPTQYPDRSSRRRRLHQTFSFNLSTKRVHRKLIDELDWKDSFIQDRNSNLTGLCFSFIFLKRVGLMKKEN
jgi:hypothetical protein